MACVGIIIFKKSWSMEIGYGRGLCNREKTHRQSTDV